MFSDRAPKSPAAIKPLRNTRSGIYRPLRVFVISVFLGALPLVINAEVRSPPPAIGFDLPLKCKLGQNCWVMNYVDHDSSSVVADSACGPRSYDGHKGTDFAVRDMQAMRRGVYVRAIAAGTVRRLRNNVNGHGLKIPADQVQGKECGNDVVIRHADGWESQYCHLGRGSIRVKRGDPIARGEPIGQIGMSGRTAFPHVHLSLRKDGQLVDPANGRPVGKGCGIGGKSLFKKSSKIRYHRSRLYAAGFAPSVPTGSDIKRDAETPPLIVRDAPAVVFWAAIFGAAKGSRLQLTIIAPDGKKFWTRDVAITRNQAWRMAYIGRKRKAGRRWPSGRYRGVATLHSATAKGKKSQTQQISVDIP